jgi:DnaJ-class molecular chaperone
MSPWDVLGLPPGASPDEIKKAYKTLAKKHHPDKGGDPEAFKRINKAYEEALNPPLPQMPDFFNHQPQHQQIRRGNSVWTVKVSLEEAYRGCVRHIKVTIEKTCFACWKSCPACQGTGQMAMFPFMLMPCVTCRGACGAGDGCAKCQHKKKILENFQLNINVPAGCEDGHQLVAQGLGEQAKGLHDIPGDLIITVKVMEHPVFLREGKNLIILKKISFEDSVNGLVFEVPHFDGGFKVSTKDWGVLDPRRDYVVQGKGLKGGDLRVGFDIAYPGPSELYCCHKYGSECVNTGDGHSVSSNVH